VTENILNKLNQAKIIDDKELKRELSRKLPFISQPKVHKTKVNRAKVNKIKSRKKSKPIPTSVRTANNMKFNDGRGFEEQYMNDSDLALAPSEEFDPSKLEKVNLDIDVEFSLE
jgi:hypothetical protein